jgi:hypothetical protein
MNRDSDTHPKDGDVKQAPLVSGAGPQGHRPNSGDNEELVERLLLSRIGQEFDGECHLTEAEARQIAALIKQLHNRVERLTNLLVQADLEFRALGEGYAIRKLIDTELEALTGEHNG